MRAQILELELDQVFENSKDGIFLIQTAEGKLKEAHCIGLAVLGKMIPTRNLI